MFSLKYDEDDTKKVEEFEEERKKNEKLKALEERNLESIR